MAVIYLIGANFPRARYVAQPGAMFPRKRRAAGHLNHCNFKPKIFHPIRVPNFISTNSLLSVCACFLCFCLMNDIKSQAEMGSADFFDFERLVQSKAVRVIDARQMRILLPWSYQFPKQTVAKKYENLECVALDTQICTHGH